MQNRFDGSKSACGLTNNVTEASAVADFFAGFFKVINPAFIIMNNKYGKTPQQRLEDALNQPSPTNDQIVAALPVYAAIDRLKMALIEDQDLREAWQSNIAVAFYDAAAKYTIENCMHWDESDARVTTEIANTAAINFLNNLCNISTSADSKKG